MMVNSPQLMFVVTEDWFFCSHFLPMARAARKAGLDVTVMCRVREHRAALEAEGCRVISFETNRQSLNPLHILSSVVRMRAVMAAEQPDIVHLIALRSVIVGGLAARLSGVRKRIIALTGMGLIGASGNTRSDFYRQGIRWFIRSIIDGRSCHFLFENRSDPMALGLEPDDRTKTTILGGAGVDPQLFKPVAMPIMPPLRVAVVSRMLWSKGIDTAIEAVRLARATGLDVKLSLYGKPDLDNPKSISEATLLNWASEPGIEWTGPILQSDVPSIWAGQHLCLLPSRGGEGLPRSLLEAASCGRGIITSDVPGCRDLVRNGIEGLVVKPDDPAALAQALLKLAQDPQSIQAMGDAARERILSGFTIHHVSDAVTDVYRNMLNRSDAAA